MKKTVTSRGMLNIVNVFYHSCPIVFFPAENHAPGFLWNSHVSPPYWKTASLSLLWCNMSGDLAVPFCPFGAFLPETSVLFLGWLHSRCSGLPVPSPWEFPAPLSSVGCPASSFSGYYITLVGHILQELPEKELEGKFVETLPTLKYHVYPQAWWILEKCRELQVGSLFQQSL